MRSGACSYGTKCRYQHEAYPPPPSSSSSSRPPKSDRDSSQRDLRHKVRHKQPESKESVSRSPSPKRKKSLPSGSSAAAPGRARRPDAESKIKSTVVVTRPRSLSSGEEDRPKEAKPPKNWEGASDGDWPLDEASLDYKEELSLEMKRQQLQRELDLLQKENHLKGAGGPGQVGGALGAGPVHAPQPAITKTVRSGGVPQHPPAQVPYSGSSETSSDSDSSSSDSSSSSSDDDSEDSSSSSSSGAGSSSRVTGAGHAAPPPVDATGGGGRHHRSRRGGEERLMPAPKARETARSGAAPHPHGKESSRHGRERHGRMREVMEGGRSPLPPVSAPRRGQDVDYGEYGGGGRSRGPRTPSPGALSEPKRNAPPGTGKMAAPFLPPKARKKKKSGKRRREREKQLRTEHRAMGARGSQDPPPCPMADSPSPERSPVPGLSRSGRRGARGSGDGAPPASRVPPTLPPLGGRGPPAGRYGRSPPPPPPHDAPRRGLPPAPKRARRDSPPPPVDPVTPPQPPPRESRKKDVEGRHGRLEEYASLPPKASYEVRYEGEGRHPGSRKREAPGYPEVPPLPPTPTHRRHGEPPSEGDSDVLEPGEVMPEHGERYVGDRGRYDQGRGRDGRRVDHHHSRSASPAMGAPPRSRLEMELHRVPEFPHSPQPGGRSRNPEPRSKPDPRSVERREPYARGPEPRDNPYRRPEPRPDPHKSDMRPDVRPDMRQDMRPDARPDMRPDYHAGRSGEYHGRGDPKPDYHGRGDLYGGRGDGRSVDSYRGLDYRDGRDPHARMDVRKEPRMERDPGYDPRQEDYGRGDDYYGRMDRRGGDYYPDGYGGGGRQMDQRDRASRDSRRPPEHISRLEARGDPHLKRGMEGSRAGDRRNDSRGRGGDRPRGDLGPDGRPYGLSKADRSDSRGRMDPHARGEEVGKGRDFYDRGDGYRGGDGGRPDPHRGGEGPPGGRGSDTRGDSGRRDYKGRGIPPKMDDPGTGRYNRREIDSLPDVRDSRMSGGGGGSRDGRGGVRSHSPSPDRGYDRKRPPVRDRAPRDSSLKREEEAASLKEGGDSREGPSSGGSRGSSPRGRLRGDKPPGSKCSRSSSRDPAPDRHGQSPDTSVPEVVVSKMEVASPLSDDSGEESPTKAEVSDSSKHMVLVEECKSEDEIEDGQESKPGAAETFSDWSDDEDDILTRDDPALEFVTKEPSSDQRNDTTSQDKTEEAAESNLIEVDAVPISPADSHRSADGDGLGLAEDFDPISDDELEALIDESEDKEAAPETAATTISDTLDIDWSSLVKETRPKEEVQAASGEKRVSARARYSGARVLARIGISKELAGEELTRQVVEFCRSQLAAEGTEEEGSGESEFKLEGLTAGFHVAAVAARRQQSLVLDSCGRYCRALSARRDLKLRRALCKVYEPSSTGPATTVDPELYKRSLQLFQSRVTPQVPLKC